MEKRFIPVRRAALDGRLWWCVFDNKRGAFSSFLCHGKYQRKRDCVSAIDRSNAEFFKREKGADHGTL